MLEKINYNDINEVDHSISRAKQHFTFSPKNNNHTKLNKIIVLNDEIVSTNVGFPLHPHKNIEILTYIIDGSLTHADSTGSNRVITSGEIEYMSAGTGIYHSEYNETDNNIRLFQIWLMPNSTNHAPNYGFIQPNEEDMLNNLHGVINTNSSNQFLKTDVKIYLSKLVDGKIEVPILEDEVGYLININGESIINGNTLKYGDALKFDENLLITGYNAHIIILIAS